jgi:hypothetical protein
LATTSREPYGVTVGSLFFSFNLLPVTFNENTKVVSHEKTHFLHVAVSAYIYKLKCGRYFRMFQENANVKEYK